MLPPPTTTLRCTAVLPKLHRKTPNVFPMLCFFGARIVRARAQTACDKFRINLLPCVSVRSTVGVDTCTTPSSLRVFTSSTRSYPIEQYAGTDNAHNKGEICVHAFERQGFVFFVWFSNGKFTSLLGCDHIDARGCVRGKRVSRARVAARCAHGPKDGVHFEMHSVKDDVILNCRIECTHGAAADGVCVTRMQHIQFNRYDMM